MPMMPNELAHNELRRGAVRADTRERVSAYVLGTFSGLTAGRVSRLTTPRPTNSKAAQ